MGHDENFISFPWCTPTVSVGAVIGNVTSVVFRIKVEFGISQHFF